MKIRQMRLLFISFLYAISQQVYGQIVYLKCNDPIPKPLENIIKNSDNKLFSLDKLALDKSKINTNQYLLYKILKSGRYLYGDSISNYLNIIANNLLIDEPEISSKIHFFTLKSDITFPFTSPNGLIFIPLGLLSNIENESQLAFLIAKEIVRFKQNHILTSELIQDHKVTKKNSYEYAFWEDNLDIIFKYETKDIEKADEMALKLLEKSKYNSLQFVDYFDLLINQIEYYNNFEFNRTDFEDSLLIFPYNFKKNDENKNMSKSQKESMEEFERRKDLLIENSEIEKSNNPLNLSGDTYFDQIQKLCFKEISNVLIEKSAFKRLYCLSRTYENKYGKNSYTNCLKSIALTGIYKGKNNEFVTEPGKRFYNKNLYEFDDFIGKLSLTDMKIIATRTVWESYILDKNNPILKQLANECIYDIFKNNKFDISFFKNTNVKSDTLISSNDDSLNNAKSDIVKKEESKIEKIKKQKKKTEQKIVKENSNLSDNNNVGYIKNAFKKLLLIPEFDSLCLNLSSSKKSDFKISYTKHTDKNSNKNAIMLKPIYIDQSIRYPKNIDYQKESVIVKYYEKNAKSSKIDLKMITNNQNLDAFTKNLNQFTILNSWINIRLKNDTFTSKWYMQNELTEICNLYNTNYLFYDHYEVLDIKNMSIIFLLLFNDIENESFGKSNNIYFLNIKNNTIELENERYFNNNFKLAFLNGISYQNLILINNVINK